jgi:hypothetical protein
MSWLDGHNVTEAISIMGECQRVWGGIVRLLRAISDEIAVAELHRRTGQTQIAAIRLPRDARHALPQIAKGWPGGIAQSDT